jgi:phage terminase large subunit-like protein
VKSTRQPSPDINLAWLKSRGLPHIERYFDGLSDELAEQLEHDWEFFARPDQLPPACSWQQWLYLAGRGSGKTRSGSEWVRRKVKQGSRSIALIAPTQADIRTVLIEGISGIQR